jgi:TolA-binding protein
MAFGEKDVKEARTRFEAVLAQDPASVFAGHALKYLAWMSFDAKDYEAAEQGYTQLAKQFPQHPASEDVDYQLALVLGARGKSEEARAAMVRFRTAHPNDARAARHDLDEAAALSKEMKYAEALRILEKLRKESPNAEALPSILYEMAWCHRGEKNVDAARADYAELLALEGDLPLKDAAALELGELEFDAQRYDKAEASLAPLLAKEGRIARKHSTARPGAARPPTTRRVSPRASRTSRRRTRKARCSRNSRCWPHERTRKAAKTHAQRLCCRRSPTITPPLPRPNLRSSAWARSCSRIASSTRRPNGSKRSSSATRIALSRTALTSDRAGRSRIRGTSPARPSATGK